MTSSIRFRLTLWYTVVMLIILTVVSVGVYIIMRNRLESIVRGKLDDGFAVVKTVIYNSNGDLFDVAHLGESNPFHLARDGKTVYRTQAWADNGLMKALEESPLSHYSSWTSPDGRFYKLKTDSIPEFLFELSYAEDASDLEESVRNLASILLAVIPCALVLALAGGYLLAGRALSPVNAITTKAREITAERLSERLPVSNPDDEIGRLAVVFNLALNRLEDSFERLRSFTADASHELRTPLTSIRSVGEVALQGSKGRDSYREAIGSMLEETERLTRLVDNLLILARGDTGKSHIVPRPVDVTSLVEEVVDELYILAEERAQTLSISGRAPVTAVIDPASIRQAVTNVMHNAIRYTQEGGRIDVSTAATDNGFAVIDITDNGPGIPESKREKVFERFYRLDDARAKTEGGAGLGLSIARWAVEANGGTIEFRDTDGMGSSCRISLPIVRDFK